MSLSGGLGGSEGTKGPTAASRGTGSGQLLPAGRQVHTALCWSEAWDGGALPSSGATSQSLRIQKGPWLDHLAQS